MQAWLTVSCSEWPLATGPASWPVVPRDAAVVLVAQFPLRRTRHLNAFMRTASSCSTNPSHARPTWPTLVHVLPHSFRFVCGVQAMTEVPANGMVEIDG